MNIQEVSTATRDSDGATDANCDFQDLSGHTPPSLFAMERSPIADAASGRQILNAGTWLTDADGLLRRGAIGVLVDNALSGILYARRADGGTGMSTSEMSVDFVPGANWETSTLTGSSRILQCDGSGGLSVGEITNDQGEAVATATLWARYFTVPGGYSPSGHVNSLKPQPGITLADIYQGIPEAAPDGAGGASLKLHSHPWLGNPQGAMHGGVVATLVEYVAGFAPVGGPSEWVPMSMRISFLRPTPMSSELIVDAAIVASGRNITVVRLSITDPRGKQSISATVTYLRK